MVTTDYFRNGVMLKRSYIKAEWLELANAKVIQASVCAA